MRRLFAHCPEALQNTITIAERCTFNLDTDLGYSLPEPDVPTGYTAHTYLKKLCFEAATRRYGTVSEQVSARLTEELALIERHRMAGFLLLYREIALIARQIMEEQELVAPETPMEERPPGRGRGSSVALLVGYLIGISHIDPLKWNLTLERFISEDAATLPDIDLDFPRSIRHTLIERIHRRFGSEYAVLAGAVTRYRAKGIIQDIGKALGLPKEQINSVSKQIRSNDPEELVAELQHIPDLKDKLESPVWTSLIELAPQLKGAPKALGQHVGGMILSSSPITEMTPIREGAITGRFIMDWDKDSAADAGFAKIDLLSLPALDLIEQTLDLIERRTGSRPDLSCIDPEDPDVYELINEGRAKGVFMLQSPAQLKIAQRLRPQNLLDLAYQVALIRPGVGVQGSAVSNFIARYKHGAFWEYDHPLEKRALERGCGIVIWQEQVVQLIMDVAGLGAGEADAMRRAFAKPNNEHLIAAMRQRFVEKALHNGVSEHTAEKIFTKINGQYMFPESHSHAFAITAYQVAWLKRYYPLEFFVSIMNNQPMGFYPIETLKQDATRIGIPFLNPCVNRSEVNCIPHHGAVLLGLRLVKAVGAVAARHIIEERARGGRYSGAGALVRRTALKPQAVESLVMAGAFDSISPNRKQALWDAALYPRPGRSNQTALSLSMEDSIPQLADFGSLEKALNEYASLGVYPKGHLMEFVRPSLSKQVLSSSQVEQSKEGDSVVVAGLTIAKQHPRAGRVRCSSLWKTRQETFR